MEIFEGWSMYDNPIYEPERLDGAQMEFQSGNWC